MVKMREQQEEVFKSKNEIIKLNQEHDMVQQEINKNYIVTLKNKVSNVREQSEPAIISKDVTTLKIVHTNDFFEKIMEVFNKGGLDENTKTPECEKCGEKFKNQTPFFPTCHKDS